MTGRQKKNLERIKGSYCIKGQRCNHLRLGVKVDHNHCNVVRGGWIINPAVYDSRANGRNPSRCFEKESLKR